MTRLVPTRRLWRALRASLSLSCLSIATTAVAFGQTPPCEHAVLTPLEAAKLLRVDAKELEELADRRKVPGRRIGSAWRFSCAALMEWLEGDAVLTPTALAEVTAAGVASPQAETATSAPQGARNGQEPPVGEAPEERAAEDVFLRGQRVLLAPGEVVLDFGLFYSRADDHLLVTVDNGVGLTTVEQHALSTLLVGRVGVFDETELFASASFHAQRSTQFLGSTSLATSQRSDLGEAQIGIRRTLLREGAGRPDIIATLGGRLATGDTPHGLGAGLILVKSVDPVVLFAGGNYLRAFSRDASAQSRRWPENRFDVSMGYGLALNDTLAISMAVSGAFSGSTRLDDSRLRQPGVFSGRFGLTSWLARGLYVEPSVSFALTGPGEGVAFGVTMPYAF